MAEIAKPSSVTFWVAHDGGTLHHGKTTPEQVTTTGLASLDGADSESLHLSNLSVHIEQLEPLPPPGSMLVAGSVYAFAGAAYMVRQEHVRTEHSPETVPALFFRHRAGGEGVEWMPGEWVDVGLSRSYDGETYKASQAHQTQLGWEPPNVAALWDKDAGDPSVAWAAGITYATGDVVTHLGVEYECLQGHSALTGWEPPNVPALWKPLNS